MSRFLAVEQTAYGIKCDNPECDWRDMTIHFTDYGNWVDHPCPCCGENLMTKANYRTFRRLLWVVVIVNIVAFPFLVIRWLLGFKEKRTSILADSKPDGSVDFIPHGATL